MEELVTIKKLLISEYGLIQEMKVTRLDSGVENKNFSVENQGKRYVLRIYNLSHSIRGLRNLASIEIELAFMQKAGESGIPVPRIILNKDSKFVTQGEFDGEKAFITVFEFLSGKSPQQVNQKIAREIGIAVDSLFSIGGQFQEVNEGNDLVTRAFRKYKELRKVGVQDERVNRLASLLKERHQETSQKKLSKGLIHGDIKLENLLFSETDELTALLDFDDYRYSYLLEEATMALMHNVHSRDENILRSGQFDAFIQEIKNPRLKKEIDVGLRCFLGTRLLYDVSKFLISGNSQLVEELWKDEEVKKQILLPNKFS